MVGNAGCISVDRTIKDNEATENAMRYYIMIRIGKPFKVGDMTLEEANDKLYKEVSKLMKENIKESSK